MQGLTMSRKPTIHDRTSTDLPFNAKIVEDVVDDPYSIIGEKLRINRSVRDDILMQLHARDQLRSPAERDAEEKSERHSGRARFEAGRKWQRYYEYSEIGAVRAIDPTKEAVDGGRASESLTTLQIVAFGELNDARKALGQDGYDLVRDVLGLRLSLTESALKRGLGNRDGRAYVGRRFRECLERLARLWGFA